MRKCSFDLFMEKWIIKQYVPYIPNWFLKLHKSLQETISLLPFYDTKKANILINSDITLVFTDIKYVLNV